MNSYRWLNRRQMENLFWLCYKRNGKRCSCATMELCMHFWGLLSTQEARVADSYASFVLSNLPRASITPCLHAARFLIRTLSINSSKCLSQLVGLSRRVTPRSFRYNTRLMVTIGSGGGHGCSSFYDKFLGLTQIKFHQILLSPEFSTSSALLVIKVLWEVRLLSLTTIVKTYRSQNNALGHTAIDRQEWGYDFVYTYPLLTIF